MLSTLFLMHAVTIKLSPADFGPDKQISLKAVAFSRVNARYLFFDGAGKCRSAWLALLSTTITCQTFTRWPAIAEFVRFLLSHAILSAIACR